MLIHSTQYTARVHTVHSAYCTVGALYTAHIAQWVHCTQRTHCTPVRSTPLSNPPLLSGRRAAPGILGILPPLRVLFLEIQEIHFQNRFGFSTVRLLGKMAGRVASEPPTLPPCHTVAKQTDCRKPKSILENGFQGVPQNHWFSK